MLSKADCDPQANVYAFMYTMKSKKEYAERLLIQQCLHEYHSSMDDKTDFEAIRKKVYECLPGELNSAQMLLKNGEKVDIQNIVD